MHSGDNRLNTNNFQRLGAESNSRVGRDFENAAQQFFAKQDIVLDRNFSVAIGVGELKKNRSFDLGSASPALLIECKSHKWTSGGNTPSAKITVWNETMFYFHISPPHYRKIMFVLRDDRQGDSLAKYYLRRFRHLVPADVEFWEFDASLSMAVKIN